MKHFSAIEKLDTGILYRLELASKYQRVTLSVWTYCGKTMLVSLARSARIPKRMS
jgi:hypothetical protein